MEDEKLFVISTYGRENPELCLIPFIAANAGLTMDIDTTLFLFASAVELAKESVARAIPQFEQMPKLATLLDSFIELGGKLQACGTYCLNRGITQEDLIANTKIITISQFIQMSMNSKVLSF